MHRPTETDTDLRQRHVLLVEYNGADFNGSQFQSFHGDVLPTVQHSLQQAVRALNLPEATVNLASRTDAGVHALGQVAHFDLPAGALDRVGNLARALNAKLPDSVSVRRAQTHMGLDFHVRGSAHLRWYRYRVMNRPQRSALMAPNTLHVAEPLDVARMDRAARMFTGVHNFGSFKCPNTHVVDDICPVHLSRVRENGDFIEFDIVATRFLYKMVRNLMGLLMAVGRTQDPVSLETVGELLEQPDYPKAKTLAPTAKPDGLTLMAIAYPEYPQLFQDDVLVQQLDQLVTKESQTNENLFRKAS